jgi:hypothetical protein
VALVIALALVFVGSVLAIGWRLANPAVTSSLRAYDVVSDEQVDVTFLVRRADPNTPVTCILRARDREGREVGRLTVEVRTGSTEVVQTESLATSGRAILGEVQECRPS